MRDQADVQRLEEKRNELRLRVGEMAAFTVVLERKHPKAEEQKLLRLAALADKGRQGA